MRILKYVIAIALGVLALTAGIVVTAVFAGVFIAVVLVRWAMHRLRGPVARPGQPASGPARPPASQDVIEVSATEVGSGTLDQGTQPIDQTDAQAAAMPPAPADDDRSPRDDSRKA